MVVRQLAAEVVRSAQCRLRDCRRMCKLRIVIDRIDSNLAQHLVVRAHRVVARAHAWIADGDAIQIPAGFSTAAPVDRVTCSSEMGTWCQVDVVLDTSKT